MAGRVGCVDAERGQGSDENGGTCQTAGFCEATKFRETLARRRWSDKNRFFGEQRIHCRAQPPLKQHPERNRIATKRRNWEPRSRFELKSRNDVRALIADCSRDLSSNVPPAALAECEAILFTLDTSKKGSRRWRSMNICGKIIKSQLIKSASGQPEENAPRKIKSTAVNASNPDFAALAEAAGVCCVRTGRSKR